MRKFVIDQLLQNFPSYIKISSEFVYTNITFTEFRLKPNMKNILSCTISNKILVNAGSIGIFLIESFSAILSPSS